MGTNEQIEHWVVLEHNVYLLVELIDLKFILFQQKKVLT
jgi:hypothetical protein